MSVPAEGPRWQRLEHDERRRQILHVARRLFSERNYASVSTAEIAREAGIARGLLHHYFGTKRELYLEVIREIVRVPSSPVPRPGPGRGLEQVISEGADRWLTLLERNRGAWLAATGGQGPGRDPEVEAILEDGREGAADRLIAALPGIAEPAPDDLRALIRCFSALAEAASVEWLQRGRLTRAQAHALIVTGFLSLVQDVLPAVRRATAPASSR
ncbi:MAG TPA: helix-turn-helix domain-containing protein [Solirubrobacteraceae bacterium]|nr:helix-turn-helix domain-containing protein [Solirubrobacteraceae bacterium]